MFAFFLILFSIHQHHRSCLMVLLYNRKILAVCGGNQISLVMSSKHTQGCSPYEANNTQNHLPHHTQWINICWTQMHRKISSLPPDRGLLIQVQWKAARPHNSPSVKSLIFLTPPLSSYTHHPAVLSSPSKTFRCLTSALPASQAAWMTLRTVFAGARQEKLSSRCTTPHLIQGEKKCWAK